MSIANLVPQVDLAFPIWLRHQTRKWEVMDRTDLLWRKEVMEEVVAVAEEETILINDSRSCSFDLLSHESK